MKKFLLSLSLLAALTATLPAQKVGKAPKPASDGPMPVITAGTNASLVKVNTTQQPWNFRIAWQKVPPQGKRGLGVLLSGNRILVTAQLVSDATYIELEQADSGKKLPAMVKAVDYEANLALLEPTVNPETFFAGLKPMTIDSGARIKDALEVWQLGTVGELISTPLTINKVQVSRYVLESSVFLTYEANGIIRSEGNSFTLPVIRNGKLAGMLLRYDSKNQVASVLPAPIIDHFLKDIADGNYQGFASLGVEFHQTLDDQFREYLGLKEGQQGVYVGTVTKGGSAESIGIKEGDIVLEMNGFKIDTRGNYKDPQFDTLSMSHIVRGKSFIGDELKVKVLREGKELTLTGKLTRKNPKDYLVWPYLFDRGSNYLVQGGLIFQELSQPYLQSFGEDWEGSAPLRLVHVAKHADEYQKQGKRKIVFLSATLPTRTTQGYERLGGLIVTKVNDREINDLADLDASFKESKDGVHKIEFEDFPRVIFIDSITCESDNLQLLKGAYRITKLKRIE
jgi:S1-C subfamily serine protease